MLEMRLAKTEEIPQQRALWLSAFGDEGAYVDHFYQWGHLHEMLVLVEDGKVQSMTALYPYPVVDEAGDVHTTGYVYALATHPEARGKGYAGMLLKYVDYYLQEKGLDGVTTVPAEASLHNFFNKNGFVYGMDSRFVTLKPGLVAQGDTLEPIDADTYCKLREGLLSDGCAVAYGRDLTDFQRRLCAMLGGGLYRVTVDGQVGICTAERHSDDLVVVKEVLLPGGDLGRVAALVGQLMPCETVELRCPSWMGAGGEVRPFGRMKWFEKGHPTAGYLGFAFD